MLVIERVTAMIGDSGRPVKWWGPFDEVQATPYGHLYGMTTDGKSHAYVEPDSGTGTRLRLVPFDPAVHARKITVTVELTEAEAQWRAEHSTKGFVSSAPWWTGVEKFNKACAAALA